MDAIAGVDTDNDTIATVVHYNIYPSEITNQSVQAELIGNSSIGMDSQSSDDVGIRIEMNETEPLTEATVLDSGPPDKATVDAWSTRPLEEAQVIRENYSSIGFATVEDEDLKIQSPTIASVQDIAMSSVHQAEIVEISEIFHSVEQELERATTV